MDDERDEFAERGASPLAAGSSAPTEPPGKPPRNSIGFGLLIGLVILLGHLASAIVPGGILLTILPGVTQWLIVIPLAVIWFRSARRESAKGLLIFAGLVSLANAVCCGVVLSSLGNSY